MTQLNFFRVILLMHHKSLCKTHVYCVCLGVGGCVPQIVYDVQQFRQSFPIPIRQTSPLTQDKRAEGYHVRLQVKHEEPGDCIFFFSKCCSCNVMGGVIRLKEITISPITVNVSQMPMKRKCATNFVLLATDDSGIIRVQTHDLWITWHLHHFFY